MSSIRYLDILISWETCVQTLLVVYLMFVAKCCIKLYSSDQIHIRKESIMVSMLLIKISQAVSPNIHSKPKTGVYYIYGMIQLRSCQNTVKQL